MLPKYSSLSTFHVAVRGRRATAGSPPRIRCCVPIWGCRTRGSSGTMSSFFEGAHHVGDGRKERTDRPLDAVEHCVLGVTVPVGLAQVDALESVVAPRAVHR